MLQTHIASAHDYWTAKLLLLYHSYRTQRWIPSRSKADKNSFEWHEFTIPAIPNNSPKTSPFSCSKFSLNESKSHTLVIQLREQNPPPSHDLIEYRAKGKIYHSQDWKPTHRNHQQVVDTGVKIARSSDGALLLWELDNWESIYNDYIV